MPETRFPFLFFVVIIFAFSASANFCLPSKQNSYYYLAPLLDSVIWTDVELWNHLPLFFQSHTHTHTHTHTHSLLAAVREETIAIKYVELLL